MIALGLHTDNWRTLSGGFELGIDKTAALGIKHVEFSVINGQYYIQAMGYEPSVSMEANPRVIKRYLDKKGLVVSQIDASLPTTWTRRV